MGQLQIIAYADDQVIVTTTKTPLIKAIEKQDKEAKRMGLELNESKTKYRKKRNNNGHMSNCTTLKI